MCGVVVAATLLFPTFAAAQPFGYGTASVTWPFDPHPFAMQAGAGGETSATGMSLGADVDVLYAPSRYEAYAYGASYAPTWTGLAVTVNVVNHAERTYGAGLRPFIAGGLTTLRGSEEIAWLHAGGGVDRWTTPRSGVRIGVDAIFAPVWPPILTARVSLLFR